jgi:hypothetical protein
MALPLIPGVPPHAIPVALVGYLVVRNFRRRNTPARIAGRGTRSRRASTSGMDGEEFHAPGRRNKKARSRVTMRR